MLRALAILLLWLGCAASSVAQFAIFQAANTSAVIPAANDATANWQKAGLAVIGGIPTTRTQCGSTVNPSGLTPPVANDDASLINTAIAACTSGHFVLLGAGTFQIAMSEVVTLNQQGVTLRGTSTGNCTNASSPICQTVIQNYDGAWPTYNGPNYCGTTTGTPPLGTAPGSFTTCPNGGNALVRVGPAFPENFLGWGTTGANICQIGTANPTTNGCGTLLAVDASKGATTVQVASTANFAVGDWVLIDDNPLYTTQTNPLFAQYVAGGAPSTTVSATPDEFNSSATPVTPRTENVDQNCTYTMCTARYNNEIKLLTAVANNSNCPGAGCTLTFDTPLTMDKRQSNSHDGRVYWLTGCGCGSGPTPPTKVAFLAQAGIENITLSRAGTGSGPLLFYMCAYCWAKGVETSYWIGGVVLEYSARVQLEGNYFHDCVDCTNDGAEYGLSVQSATTEALVENNIIVFTGKSMVGRSSAGNVVAYNYGDKTFYQQQSIGNWLIELAMNPTHGAGSHHMLLEGNWTPNCDGDQTHGPGSHQTYYKNDCNGFRSNFDDPSNPSLHVSDVNDVCYDGVGAGSVMRPCSRQRAAGPMSYNYWYAFAGNVFGNSATTTANGWIYSARTPGNRGTGANHPMTDKALIQSGWTGNDPGNCCNYVSDPNLDGTNSTQFIFLHGNYDFVNGAIVDFAAGYSRSLPNSLYIVGGGAPSWWPAGSTTYPYPWIDSTSGTPVKSNSLGGSALPAKSRYDNATPFANPHHDELTEPANDNDPSRDIARALNAA